MSILDDAIREHLELKRAHGADEAELKKLEDEAFGPPGRPEEPDPFSEAPTEFMATPEVAEPTEQSGRRINIADLQEPPPPEGAGQRGEPRVEATDAIEPEADAPPVPAEDAAQVAPPAEEQPPAEVEQTAMEHEIVVEPAEEAPAVADADPGEETRERRAIAEQPTELFDIEAEMGTEDAAAAEPAAEIQASRAEPPAAPLAEEDEDEEDEEFWSDQRLSDELDQALEAPLTDEQELPALTDEHDIPAPVAEPSALTADEEEDDEDETPRPDYDPDTGHEDVLEDTPDFLEDAPEDDELWFEQKPPKDFDLD